MHFSTCAASNHCCPVLEKGLEVLFKYCVLVGSSSIAMAAGSFLELWAVQVVDCCCRSDPTLGFLELRLSVVCRCVVGAAVAEAAAATTVAAAAALFDLFGDPTKEMCLDLCMRRNDLSLATASAEVPFADFLHP